MAIKTVSQNLKNNKPATRNTALRCSMVAIVLLLVGCAASPSTLSPQGPAATRIANLWWFLLVLGTLVFLVVLVFLFFALFGRKREDDATNSMRKGSRIVLYGGIIGPAVVLLVVFG